MPVEFNNCIAIGVEDKDVAARRLVAHFGCQITDQRADWVEVTAGPLKLYLVQDGTNDVALSVNVPRSTEASLTKDLEADGFQVEQETTARVGETFVSGLGGVLVNLYPTD